MNQTEIISQLLQVWSNSDAWHRRAACVALCRQQFFLIPTRDLSGPYLLRMWLSPPVLTKRGSRERFESASSLLLHYFFRGDDDQALHDHPWDFTTRILAGGYQEHLPPSDWIPGSTLGPAWDKRMVEHPTRSQVHHVATDLHCVGMVQPETFTMVETGPAVREWGFHPEGREWIKAEDYLTVDA